MASQEARGTAQQSPIIDLNADIGESFGVYTIGHDERLLRTITSGSIACGFHAGDPDVMRHTIGAAVQARVSIGAHPGFPDLAGFGRREMNMRPAEIVNLVLYQVGALSAMAKVEGATLRHVKPHGALYNMSVRRADVAEAVAEAVARFDRRLLVIGMPGSELLLAASRLGLAVAAEGFADRSYENDGSLTPRHVAGAVLSDRGAAVDQAIRMVRDRTVISRDGTKIALSVDTICVHGDTPAAADLAIAVRTGLEQAGIPVSPL